MAVNPVMAPPERVALTNAAWVVSIFDPSYLSGLTGTSLKYQRKLSQAVKRARHLGLMPYVADNLK